MQDQGVNSSVGSTSAPLIAIFTHRAWGGLVAAPGLLHRPVADAESLSLEGERLSTTVDVAVTLLTLEPAEAPNADAWPAALAQGTDAQPTGGDVCAATVQCEVPRLVVLTTPA